MKTYYIKPKSPELDTFMKDTREEFKEDIYNNPGKMVNVEKTFTSSVCISAPFFKGYNDSGKWNIFSNQVNGFLQETPPNHFEESLFEL